jgi:hypothetical protein
VVVADTIKIKEGGPIRDILFDNGRDRLIAFLEPRGVPGVPVEYDASSTADSDATMQERVTLRRAPLGLNHTTSAEVSGPQSVRGNKVSLCWNDRAQPHGNEGGGRCGDEVTWLDSLFAELKTEIPFY